MIESLRFRNFKALADVEVPLARFTMLVGPNACGKSTVLQGADFLGSLWKDESEYFEPSLVATSWTPQRWQGWCTDRSAGPISLQAHADRQSLRLTVRRADAVVEFVPGNTSRLTGSISSASQPRQENEFPRQQLRESAWLSTLYLRVYAEFAAEPSYSDDEVPTLGYGGRNLPSVLAHLALTQPDVLAKIREALRRVVPQVTDLRMPRRKVETLLTLPSLHQEQSEVMGNGLELVIDGVGNVDASEVSEGTLRTLAILTAVHTAPPAAHMLVLVDDLDQALHPSAQAELVKLLRGLLEAEPRLQIIATTHSPYLLDAFEEDEVLVLQRDAHGHTQCRKLTDHPDWSEWKGRLHLGEFWSSTGEDWVVAPRAVGDDRG